MEPPVPLLPRPYPEPIERLKQALYPRLLPIARDWWSKLGRPTPWPDSLDDWLATCHAGQTRSTALILKYGTNDWNALHQDLYGDLVFPLQVVINLSDPGTDYTGVNSCSSNSGSGPNPRHRNTVAARPRLRLHHPRPSGTHNSGMVGFASAARAFDHPVR